VNKEQREWTDGLYEMTQWFEANPDLIPQHSRVRVILDGVAAKDELAALSKRLGGKRTKSTTDSFFWLDRSFGPHTVGIAAWRDEVCEKVTRLVAEEVTERDPELLARVPTVTRTIEREVVEWVCPDSFLAP
jgi:2'-5' RNA ligase